MIKINETDKKLIIRFCHAERIKSAVLNMMQIFIRFQDYLENKQEEPDGRTILSWFLDLLNNDIYRAASISKSKYLFEAQNRAMEVIQKIEIIGQGPNFQEILDILRKVISNITSEAATVAKELMFD